MRVREAADRCVSAVAQRLSAFGRKYVRSDPGAHPSCYAQKCEGLRMKCRVNLKCPRCDVGLAYDRAAKSVTESDQGRGVGGAEYEGVNSDAVVLGELCGELSRNAALCGSLREVGVARRLLKLLASLGVVRRDIENQRAETKRCFSVEELDAETRRRKICAQAAQARVCLDKNSRERCSLEELMQHAERTYLLRKEQSLRNYFSSGVREPEAVKAAAAENDLEQGRLEDLVRELSLSSEVMAARTELESRLLNARKSREQCESLVQRETAALHIREAVKVATEQLIGEKLDSINTRMQAILESLFCGRAEQVPRCRLVSNRQKKSKAKRTAPRRGCVVASGSDADTKWEICLVSEHAGFTASGSLFFSGGEYDRVSLALALALAETTGARFLMLDETLGSVEEDTANRVIEVLDSWSKRCGGAPVYLIAHQLDGNGCEVLEM
ncbi:hypothetical protein JKY79_02280 [Candidatus Babeliales bacterium]|nr:hypothetical protein [Candidatus Babeliales bacterium]